MSDIRRLVEMMQQQMEAQRQQTEILQKQMLEQQGAQQEVQAQREAYQQQMEALVNRLTTTSDSSAGTHPAASIPTFTPFDSQR